MPDSREAPQIDRLIAEIAARHGILLKRDDAAFALVTLNQLVLEDAIKDLAGQIRAATEEFESTFERVQAGAGATLAKALSRAVAALQSELNVSIAKLDQRSSVWRHLPDGTWWLPPFAAGFAVALFLHWVW